jgi:hypothetical protein
MLCPLPSDWRQTRQPFGAQPAHLWFLDIVFAGRVSSTQRIMKIRASNLYPDQKKFYENYTTIPIWRLKNNQASELGNRK